MMLWVYIVFGLIVLNMLCAIFPPKETAPWWEDMDRLHMEYEDDIYGEDAWGAPNHAVVDFDVWYREKYCTNKQPEAPMPERLYR